MSDVKRVLVLYSDAGFGHKMVSTSVQTALKEAHGDNVIVTLVNPFDDKRTPAFLRDSQSDYDRWVREVPELYRFGYNASDSMVPTAIVESVVVAFMAEIIEDILKKYRPDVILCTYPLFQAPLVSVFAMRRHRIPLLTVITDLVGVHRMWFNKKVDTIMVPTQLAADQAMSNGIIPAKIKITGVPINPEIVHDTRSQAELRADLGWDPNLTTFLAVGSRRVERLVDMLDVANHFGAPIQLAVVTGNDEVLYGQLRAMDWHVPVHLYEYITNVPTLMKAADCVICKAGGLIVTESLACGRPIILIDVIPGQESGNAEYVLQQNAADLAEAPLTFLQVIAHLLREDGKLLHERAAHAKQLGKPDSALRAADLVWEAALNGPTPRRKRSSRRFVDFLQGKSDDSSAANGEMRPAPDGKPGE